MKNAVKPSHGDGSDTGMGKPVPVGMDFAGLVSAIREVHAQCAAHVRRTVNTTLTVRNWMIGGFIHQYELNGSDRAAYGDQLIERLAGELTQHGVESCTWQRLYSYLAFYRTYPQIGDACHFIDLCVNGHPILRSLTGESAQEIKLPIFRSLTGESFTSGKLLLERLSYTHLELLMALDDPFKRAFYEIECIRGNWSVRQLKRQIATLYFGQTPRNRRLDAMSSLYTTKQAAGLGEKLREMAGDSTLILVTAQGSQAQLVMHKFRGTTTRYDVFFLLRCRAPSSCPDCCSKTTGPHQEFALVRA